MKRALVAVLVLALACTSAALATKPGSGSTGPGNPPRQFDFGGGTMPALAADIVEAAGDLYGVAVAGQVAAAFASRGIL